MNYVTNIGNIDIYTGDKVVILRMRHVVKDHPGCYLTYGEIRTFINDLQQLLTKAPSETPAPVPNLLASLLPSAPQAVGTLLPLLPTRNESTGQG